MTKLAGYRKFNSKKNGKDYCVAFLLHDIGEREMQAGFVGQKIEELFLPDSYINSLKPDDVGKQVILDYEVNNGNAYLVKFSVK